MRGYQEMLYQYIGGSNKRFSIPVYQRNYDWQIEHCRQLYNDPLRVHNDKKSTHFFGSIVSAQDEM